MVLAGDLEPAGTELVTPALDNLLYTLLAGTLYFLRIWLCHKILFWQKAHFLEIFGKNTCCIVCLFVSTSKDISVLTIMLELRWRIKRFNQFYFRSSSMNGFKCCLAQPFAFWIKSHHFLSHTGGRTKP